MRIVNSGRRELALGAEYTQHWVDGEWHPMRLPPEFISGLVLTLVPPHTVSGCTGPLTLRRWPAGKYRWLLGVRLVHSHGLGPSHLLRATFRLRSNM
jgi:hypothetical protein